MRSRVRPARRRSIRALLALLFVVPLVSLLALWGFAASVTLHNALQEHNFTTEDRLYGESAQTLGFELALERSQSFVWLSSGRKTPIGPLLAQRRATDAAVAAFQAGVNANPGIILPSAKPALASSASAMSGLGSIRAMIDSGQMTALAAFEAYNAIIDAQFHFYSQLIVVNDVPLYLQAAASLQAGRALEMADREVTLVNGALAAGGRMSKSERLLFAQTVANQRLLIGDALKQLDPSLGAGYQSIYTSPAYASFTAIENRVIDSIGSDGPIPVNPAAWNSTSFSLLAGFEGAEQQDRLALAKRGTQVGDRLLLEVVLAGGLGLLAVALSVYLMARFGRRISRELTGLQHTALELATDRLPRVVEQLSRGKEIDASAEAPPSAAGRITEIAKVSEAFDSVHRTAVEAAVGQARLRRGVSQVFRNLAWRSQSLLHRQLALLDRMERRSMDPEALGELFQLDHLTTRMRRHAEGLIILSGEAPGRGWHEPVPVVDVLRAAIAEVEDYTRVGVITRSGDAVIGAAVADVIHLLAELIENATTNSPASTEVTVRADRVAHGIAVEVEDRGLGMSQGELATANELLANSPEFDLADTDKLGFFVVARLAARHDVKITLRPSPYGGIAAIVLLPHAITVARESAQVEFDTAFPDRLQLPAAGWQPGGVAPDTELAVGLAPAAEAAQDPWAAQEQPYAGLSATTLRAASDGTGSDAAGPPGVGQADPDTAAPESYLGLPQRVREDSLPHRSSTIVPSPVGEAPPQSVTDQSTPEEIGAMVASLQEGWLGGRAEAAAQPDES